MTVQQLIDHLKTMPLEKEIVAMPSFITEGTDPDDYTCDLEYFEARNGLKSCFKIIKTPMDGGISTFVITYL